MATFFVEIIPLVCYVTMNLYTGVISWIVLRFSIKKHLWLSELVCCCLMWLLACFDVSGKVVVQEEPQTALTKEDEAYQKTVGTHSEKEQGYYA